MDNAETRKGFAEPSVKKLRVNQTIQFERIGFFRLDKKLKDKMIFCFIHQ